MRSLPFCFVALAMTAPAYTQTTPPAAPSVTAGAEFKGLRFDWESVPGAGWYQFEYRAHQTGLFVQLGTNYSAATTNIRLRLPLHLFDWTYARYRIAACNSAGCTRSNEVSVSDLRRDAVGYFKSPQPEIYDHYGADTDITPDGLNFVVAAPTPFRYDSQGNYIGSVTLPGAPGPVPFNEPWSVAVDEQGFVYIADTWNHRIVKFSPSLQFLTTWGRPAAQASRDSRQSPQRQSDEMSRSGAGPWHGLPICPWPQAASFWDCRSCAPQAAYAPALFRRCRVSSPHARP